MVSNSEDWTDDEGNSSDEEITVLHDDIKDIVEVIVEPDLAFPQFFPAIPSHDIEEFITLRRSRILQNFDTASIKRLTFTEDVAKKILSHRGAPIPAETLLGTSSYWVLARCYVLLGNSFPIQSWFRRGFGN
jgi:hypothetical protein